MKNLELNQMERIEGKASWECWAMFAGTAVGAIGAPLNPFLAAGMISVGVQYISKNC